MEDCGLDLPRRCCRHEGVMVNLTLEDDVLVEEQECLGERMIL